MNSNLHLQIRIIGNAARALVRKIILVGRPLIGIEIRIIQLPLRKHHQIAMEHPSEGDVDFTRLVEIGYWA